MWLQSGRLAARVRNGLPGCPRPRPLRPAHTLGLQLARPSRAGLRHLAQTSASRHILLFIKMAQDPFSSVYSVVAAINKTVDSLPHATVLLEVGRGGCCLTAAVLSQGCSTGCLLTSHPLTPLFRVPGLQDARKVSRLARRVEVGHCVTAPARRAPLAQCCAHVCTCMSSRTHACMPGI